MGDYRPQEIEEKWQKRWNENRVFESEADVETESSGAKAHTSVDQMSDLKVRPPKEGAEKEVGGRESGVGSEERNTQAPPFAKGAQSGASRGKPKYYVLEMLPYPSGTLHMGHMRNYTIGDVVARVKRMKGYNVLHPMGWDAFGLPAENAAIKNHTHPRVWTKNNIAEFQRVLRRFGFSYDWRREISTCEPEYYKWNQWFFLRMLERGIAYKKKSRVNWCPKCCTVLANEQVVNGGFCWRHEDTRVEAREIEQWFLKTTAYAEQLLDDLKLLEGGWPERVITMQRNWIGKSTGAKVWFGVEGEVGSRESVVGSEESDSSGAKAQVSEQVLSELKLRPPKEKREEKRGQEPSFAKGAQSAAPGENPRTQAGVPVPQRIEIFTTRIDTIYGASALILAPNHPLVDGLIRGATAEGEGLAGRENRAQELTKERLAKLAVMKQTSVKMEDIATAEKDGFFTGRYAVNPFNRERIPIWVGNFVLMEYGTGAIMAVPGHDERDFEFCRKYGLPVMVVVEEVGSRELGVGVQEAESSGAKAQGSERVMSDLKVRPPKEEEKSRSLASLRMTNLATGGADGGENPRTQAGVPVPLTEYGISVNSGPYSGMRTEDAIENMAADAEAGGFGKKETIFRLRDWGISRQRYWGTPIPVIYCEKDGMVPVPDEDLPVVLPANPKLTGEGQSPLVTDPEFVNVKCPKCGGPARRETDTMDTFVDSSWYFYRYCDPRNDKAPYDSAKVGYWFPIEQYIGGITHAILHLLYSRFWCKVMRDIGLISHSEPAARLFTQGMVLKGGEAMSKSRGNVVGAIDMAEKYGADTGRLYTLFAAPPEKDLEWSEESIEGAWRFLNRVYRLVEKGVGGAASESSGAKAQILERSMSDLKVRPPREESRSLAALGMTGGGESGTPRTQAGVPVPLSEGEKGLLRKAHQTLRRVTADFETRWHFNSAIAQIMELTNAVYAADASVRSEVRREVLEILVLMLAPMTPHLAEELWELLGHEGGLWTVSWPAFNAELAKDEEVEIVVQINGKVRGKVKVAAGATEDEVMRLARGDAGVAAHLAGKTVVNLIFVKDKLLNVVVR